MFKVQCRDHMYRWVTMTTAPTRADALWDAECHEHAAPTRIVKPDGSILQAWPSFTDLRLKEEREPIVIHLAAPTCDPDGKGGFVQARGM